MEFLKVKSFSGLELTKIEKGEETMTYGNFSSGKMSVEKLLGQITWWQFDKEHSWVQLSHQAYDMCCVGMGRWVGAQVGG